MLNPSDLVNECGKNREFSMTKKRATKAAYFRAIKNPATRAVNGAVLASPKLPATVFIISEATRLLFRML